VETTDYKLIVTIVSKGKGEHVAKAACRAGAKGGTIIPGHGLAAKLMLGISIAPEKDVVLTLIGQDLVQKIIDAILEEVDLNEPNKGISFVVPLDSVIGIRNENDKEP
jgi:nitrogen regulatory protein PII